MLEIEAKAEVDDLEAVREAVLRRGGAFLGREVQRDVYFAHPKRDFAETDEALRMREAGGRFFLTYKGPKLDRETKTREEFEVEVFDAGNAEEILHRLGFRRVLEVRKTRESYRLPGYRVMLDEVEGLGSFVELEKEAGDYSPQEMADLFKDLGIDPARMERRSYLELLLEKI
ncbi:MAG: class IV adenylate cyclase [Euryarchaeota archaeon]|nr:class IV adenylate cyclase [Euryarchaeota archaeon]